MMLPNRNKFLCVTQRYQRYQYLQSNSKTNAEKISYLSGLYEYVHRIIHRIFYGNTDLHYDAIYAAKLNIEQKSSINAANYAGETPLILAVKKPCNTLDDVLMISGMIETLFENDAGIHKTDNQGMNALLHAADNHKLDIIVRNLIDIGVDPTSFDNNGNTGLHFAAKNGNLDMVRLFHSYLPIDSYNKLEVTPLMITAFNAKIEARKSGSAMVFENYNYFNAAKYLIESGANVIKRNSNKFNAFDAALIGKNDDIIKLMLNHELPKLPCTSMFNKLTKKNRATRMFERMVLDQNISYRSNYNNGLWTHFNVNIDGTEIPLLDILRNVEWNKVRFSEGDYKKLEDIYSVPAIDITPSMQYRLGVEPEINRDNFRLKLENNYNKLTNLDVYFLRQSTGMLSRHMGEIMAGVIDSHSTDCESLIRKIGIVVNALNKMEPEHYDYVYKGHADIYKINKNGTPMFVCASKVYDVAEIYAVHGPVVNKEGHGKGHTLFLRDIWGYDISGLSTVPSAREIITLPSIIKYQNENIAYEDKSNVIPYHFATLQTTAVNDASL